MFSGCGFQIPTQTHHKPPAPQLKDVFSSSVFLIFLIKPVFYFVVLVGTSSDSGIPESRLCGGSGRRPLSFCLVFATTMASSRTGLNFGHNDN